MYSILWTPNNAPFLTCTPLCQGKKTKVNDQKQIEATVRTKKKFTKYLENVQQRF